MAVAAGAASETVLIYITRGLGAYYLFISILGGFLVTVLAFSPSLLDIEPFPTGSGRVSAGLDRPPGITPHIMVVLALAALLSILLLPSVVPLRRIDAYTSDFSFYLLPFFLFAIAVFLLCLAGDLLMVEGRAERHLRPGLAGKLRGFFADFSWAVFSLSVYLVLTLFLVRLVFPAHQPFWDPLMEMFLAEMAGSGLAWILTLRLKEARGGNTAPGTRGEA